MKTDRHCRWTRPRLPLLAGGELGPDERRKVERHLIACPDCRGHRDASVDALGALRLLAEEPFATVDAAPLWPALALQIRQSRHAAPRPSWWDSAFARPWGLVGLAAGLGALMVASVPSPWADRELALPSSSVAVPPAWPEDEDKATPPPLVVAAPSRPGALPSGPSSRVGLLSQGPLKPVEPPSASLQFDYDLDHGTPMTPGNHDPQRTF